MQLTITDAELVAVLQGIAAIGESNPTLAAILAAVQPLRGIKLMTAQQGNDLIAAVQDVKTQSDAEAIRLDKALADLQAKLDAAATADPAVASAISTIQGVSQSLKMFHADTIIPPSGGGA